ncbi:MAG: HAMP domain-containing protein [Acidobacteria bacterium]|nr:HAMP domain-containing protein [Acidobacteriota bacterium]
MKTQESKSDRTQVEARSRYLRRRLRIILLSLVTVFLFAMLFIQAAFNTLPWFRPSSASETLTLYALSTINFLAFVVLLMVLVRNIIKLRRERLEKRLGARFKTRLVVYFISLSLLPVIFLFFATTGLINRSIDKWFSLPANEMLTNAWQIQNAYVNGEQKDLVRTVTTIARLLAATESAGGSAAPGRLLGDEIETQKLALAQFFDRNENLLAQRVRINPGALDDRSKAGLREARARALAGENFDMQISVDGEPEILLIAATPVPGPAPGENGGALIIAQQVSPNLVGSVQKIREFMGYYESLRNEQKGYRSTSLLTLSLITLLVLFIAYWLALYVSRSIAEPVQKLAEATEHIKRGDLSYRADVVGDDELASLAMSFNEMTAELAENRTQLELSAADLTQTNSDLNDRRRYIEAVLQSLSAGVISLNEYDKVTTINEAARRLLHIEKVPETGVALEQLLPESQREELRRMVLRAVRLRSVTREVHFTLANHAKLDASVTVTALQDPSGQARGAVIVLEDLTELIEAQRRAAWSEVAKRMAHEIKNPLTPIRLSAERLAKNLLGDGSGANGGPLECLSDRQTRLVRECTGMIGTEVATLQRMVDEFSSFARLPSTKLEITSLNEIAESAIRLYDERLEGLRLEAEFSRDLPPVAVDSEQIKRVLVNLIDNAADALAGSDIEGKIKVITRGVPDRDAVELIVADNGPGIAPADRERVFDPYFSTRKRGTGLGLAIVSRIVADHNGRIRLQENLPTGARFIVELPAAI